MTRKDITITKKGDGKPFVFISYSSKDKSTVVDGYARTLQERYGLRVYYDDSFSENATDGWTKQMRMNMQASQCVIIFVSGTYKRSYACLLELLYAIAFDKPVIRVQISGSPQETAAGSSVRTISDTTIEAFKKVKKILELANVNSRTKAARYQLELLDDSLQERQISTDDIQEALESCISSLENITLQGDIYESVWATLINLNKNNKIKDVFEEVRETVPETAAVPPEEIADDADDTDEEEQSGGSDKKAFEARIVTYSIYGETFTQSHAEMMYNVFEKVLAKHSGLLPALIGAKGMNCLSATGFSDRKNAGEKFPSYFRQTRYFDIGSGVWVGTSYDLTSKLKKIALLIAYCGESPEIFRSEELQLPVVSVESIAVPERK